MGPLSADFLELLRPAHNWFPVFGCTLTPKDRRLAIPDSAGRVLARTFPDSAAGTKTWQSFYDLEMRS